MMVHGKSVLWVTSRSCLLYHCFLQPVIHWIDHTITHAQAICLPPWIITIKINHFWRRTSLFSLLIIPTTLMVEPAIDHLQLDQLMVHQFLTNHFCLSILNHSLKQFLHHMKHQPPSFTCRAEAARSQILPEAMAVKQQIWSLMVVQRWLMVVNGGVASWSIVVYGGELGVSGGETVKQWWLKMTL